MTLIASILFATALAFSIGTIVMTVRRAAPRIVEVIEAEFASAPRAHRTITFGDVRGGGLRQPSNVVAFPVVGRLEQDFKLAA